MSTVARKVCFQVTPAMVRSLGSLGSGREVQQFLQRLIKDFKALQNDPPLGVNASPHPDNVMQWNAVIFGPEGTVWEDGIFRLTLEFSEDYPQKAPNVKFVSTLFHPNGNALLRNVMSLHVSATAFKKSLHSGLPPYVPRK